MDTEQQDRVMRDALQRLADRCPRLFEACYWAGTSAIAMEELHHRQSFDLDFHTREALRDVRPFLADVQRAFPGDFQIVQAPDAFGSGFQGVLTLPSGDLITIEMLSNFEDVPPPDLVRSKVSPRIWRITLARYLADKVQCLVERAEARDLIDVWAVVCKEPAMVSELRRLLRLQDSILLVERLQAWSDEAIADDLEAYEDVSGTSAQTARDQLLAWLKESPAAEEPG